MPHLDIKSYPKHLTQQELDEFRQALLNVVTHHLKVAETDISIRFTEVPPEKWKTEVWTKEIVPHMADLLKKPGYKM